VSIVGLIADVRLPRLRLKDAASAPRVPETANGSRTAPRPRRSRTVIFMSIALAVWIAATECARAHLRPSPVSGFPDQPSLWPLPWRPSLAALDDPVIRWRVAISLIAVGIGVVSAVAGLRWRRARIICLAGSAGLLLAALPAMRLLLVPAYPTSFFHSPTRFAAASIVSGQVLFAAYCVACHGASGHGNGPSASQLPIPPADLTAPHLWSHSDGDLFWQISNGSTAPDGSQAMPSFRMILSADDQWNLIDFIRANNAGVNQKEAGAWIVPIIAPALPMVCADKSVADTDDLRGNVVRVVADGDEEADIHPPAIPSQQGYPVTILHLTRGGISQPARGECVATARIAWSAYAILAGVSADALAGAEFLVDPQGWLRAVWLPGSSDGWRTPDQLIARVRQICTHAVAPTPTGVR
jgi:mono/diheme cytochrome c family protein